MFRIGRAYNIAGPDETDANAHLIAAAPDMLAALKRAQRLVYVLGHNGVGVPTDDRSAIDAAIAKATGQ